MKTPYIGRICIYSIAKDKYFDQDIGVYTDEKWFKKDLSIIIDHLVKINQILNSYKLVPFQINFDIGSEVYISLLCRFKYEYSIIDINNKIKTDFGAISSKITVVKIKINTLFINKA